MRNRHNIANRIPNAVGNSINTACPKSWTLKHIRTRYKTLQLKEDREAVIHMDNTILLKAMARTLTTPGDSMQPFHQGPVGAITAAGRRRYLTAITKDNRFYLEHLIRTPPVYTNKEWQRLHERDIWNLGRMRKFHYERKHTALDKLADQGHSELKQIIASRQRAIKARAEQPCKEEEDDDDKSFEDESGGEMSAAAYAARKVERPPTSGGPKSMTNTHGSLMNSTPKSSHVVFAPKSDGLDGPSLASSMPDMNMVPMPGAHFGARPQTTSGGAASLRSASLRGPSLERNAVLCRQAQWLVVVPSLDAPTRGFSGSCQRLWGEITVSFTADNKIEIVMNAMGGARQTVNVTKVLSVDEVCKFTNRMDFPTRNSECVELALLLSQNVHIRGDSPEIHEIRLDHDTPSLANYASKNAAKPDWMNQAPTRVFRTASVMQQGSDAAATHAALAKMAQMAENEDEDDESNTSASQSEPTTMDDEGSVEANKNAIVAEYRKVRPLSIYLTVCLSLRISFVFNNSSLRL